MTGLVAHWTLWPTVAATLSLPTGTGKTAVAMAAPFLTEHPPSRVLVVVPSKAIRAQVADHFRTQRLLERIGALRRGSVEQLPVPRVCELAGRPNDWNTLTDYDVVVALPNSISPVHFDADSQPPPEMFDLIVIDEAHHAPAPTWQAILAHFPAARAVLLTATPVRRDGKELPGRLVYHFPLRKALADGLYQTIEPKLLTSPPGASKGETDIVIAAAAVEALHSPEHATSALLIRAASVSRTNELVSLYGELGCMVEPLHSQMSSKSQAAVIGRIRDGSTRAVAVVGMLGEGFDLASLRLAAYHDKHKSLPATVQLIGRLARVDPAFPQKSMLITVRDADVYPQLKGVVRDLYEEDADWVEVLPGIIDDEIEKTVRDREFSDTFRATDSEISPNEIHPLQRAVAFEVLVPDWRPPFVEGTVPEALAAGEQFLGGVVVYSGTSGDHRLLTFVVARPNQPRWYSEGRLGGRLYSLQVVAFRQSPRTDLPSFVFVNCARPVEVDEVARVLGMEGVTSTVSGERISMYVDGLNRTGVSSVGLRNTRAANRGTATYKNLMGSKVERGLRASDTIGSALGHAMFQVEGADGTSTGGLSTGKAKVWMTRYSSLRIWDEWITDLAQRLWFEAASPSGPLLPNVARGNRLESWPTAEPFAAELPPTLLNGGYDVVRDGEVLGRAEDLDVHVGVDPTGRFTLSSPDGEDLMHLAVVLHHDGIDEAIWHGGQSRSGEVNSLSPNIHLKQGYSSPKTLASHLTTHPPVIYFSDGSTVQGSVITSAQMPATTLPDIAFDTPDWSATNVGAETRATALEQQHGISIHESLEQFLINRPSVGRRWILCNDGKGEIADYIVVEETSSREVRLGLWHAKAAGGAPGLRIKDMQVVIAQAIRSRRWYTDPRLWEQLCRRLTGDENPPAVMVAGSASRGRLLVHLGYDPTGNRRRPRSWRRRSPVLIAEVGIVQPGLSLPLLRAGLEQTPPTHEALGIRELLGVFSDTVAASSVVLASGEPTAAAQ